MKKVLLLNRSCTPIGMISWRKAVSLVIGRQRAEILNNYNEAHTKFRPAVIKLVVPSPDPYSIFSKKIFCKKRMFLRDNFECQYCSRYINIKEGTIDHVIPVAQGGETSFLNCVAACKSCNQTKSAYTPEQAGMKLINRIRLPTIRDMFNGEPIPQEWKDFIF